MLFVMRYAMTPGASDRVMDVYPRHRAYLDRMAEGGEILLIGPLLPAPGSGAMAVFRTRKAADAFAGGDPFVLEGLAEPLPVQEWDALEYR
ncbi:MAG: YciI family protein [Amnibacterium sp.]